MKRKILFLLVTLMAVCMITSAALAESWTCPSCGATNDGNFCSNCGAKNPEAGDAATITNVTFTPMDNGDTLVEWDDSASSSSYSVEYTAADWDVTYDMSSFKAKRVILEFLVPGVTYQVTISNGSSEVSETYTVPRPLFSEFTAGEQYLDLSKNKFSLSDLEENPMTSFQVQVRYPMLSHSRDYTAKLVLNTPYGYCGSVVRWDSYTFENEYTYCYSTFYMQSEWLDEVEDSFGSVPTGDYTFEMFMDGQLYGYADFTLVN